MLKELINLSNELDQRNLRKEADYLDWVIKYAVDVWSMPGSTTSWPSGPTPKAPGPPIPDLPRTNPVGPRPPHGGYPTPRPTPTPPPAGGVTGTLAASLEATTAAGAAVAGLVGLVAGTVLVYWWPDFLPGASGKDVTDSTAQTMAMATQSSVLGAIRKSLSASFKRRKSDGDTSLKSEQEAVRQFFTKGSPNEVNLYSALAKVNQMEWRGFKPEAGGDWCPPAWWKIWGKDRSCVDMEKAMEIYNETVGEFITNAPAF